MADIKKALRVALALCDMNQTQLGEALGVAPQQVSRWVNGDIKVETIGKIAEALGMSMSELVALGE